MNDNINNDTEVNEVKNPYVKEESSEEEKDNINTNTFLNDDSMDEDLLA